MLADWPEGRQKVLGMTGRLEAAHRTLSLSRRLMRVFGTIVEAFVPAMLDARQDLALNGAIAGELVCDDYTRNVLAAFQEFAEELPGGSLVASALHQDIQDVPILVDRPPQVVGFAVDLEENFIQKPLVAWACAATAQLIGRGLSEPQTPLPYGFIRHHDATLRK